MTAPDRPGRGDGRIELSVLAAAAGSAAQWTRTARFAEDAGFASLLVSDHLHEQLGPVAALLKAAEATERLGVGSLVFNLDLRHPALLAKEAATIDLFCGGRFELGVGAGWDRREYECLGLRYEPPRTRIARLREGVTVLRLLLGPGTAAFRGRYYQVAGLDGQPKPAGGRVLPILVGGGGCHVLSLAAELADVVGLNVRFTAAGLPDPASLTAAAVARRMAVIGKAAGARGWRPAIQILVQEAHVTGRRNRVAGAVADRRGLGRAEVLESPYFLIGTSGQIAADVLRYSEMYGITRWTIPQRDMTAFAPVAGLLGAAGGSP